MGRIWSLLFLTVPILGVGMFVFAIADIWPFSDGAFAFGPGYWLPENINEHGRVIDNLFMFILYLTGIIFIGTGIAMFVFLWRYDAAKNTEPVKFTHGSHTLEVVWSVLPAATLLFIAVYQMNAWADHKMRRPTVTMAGVEMPKPALAKVTGRQFEWRIQYAGADGIIDTVDDLHTVNELHVPVDEDVVLQIESQDVLHSFFLPHMRVKQDVVPGMRQFAWFRANQTGTYDIVCAELCGWGHYKMRGRIVIESRDNFDRWFEEQMREQNRAEYSKPSEES